MSSSDSVREAPPTASGLVATLAPVLLISAVSLIIFLCLRKSQKRFYSPRTYLGSLRENQRSPALPNGWFNWIGPFHKIPDITALQNQSLDAYLSLRFLRKTVLVCFVGCCMIWPFLFPLNATGNAGQKQLNLLSFSNIGEDQHNRYYGHVFISCLFFGFVMFLIMRECIYSINLRQAFLLSPLYSKRISSRTVLFVSVPETYLHEAKLRKVFGDAVRHIWITSDTEDVDRLVKERDKVAYMLEKAEVKLIKVANKIRAAALKKGALEEGNAALPLDIESGSLAARWVPAKKRPHHRIGFLGLMGKKVDTINWCRTELERLTQAANTAQQDYLAGATKKMPSVFVEFCTQADAEAAVQVVTHHQSLYMAPRYIGITPSEVVWNSLKMSWWRRVVLGYAVAGFIIAMIMFWAIPVAVVGIISNITFLEGIFFLTWLKKIPNSLMGVVTGLLPSVMLSILMSLVPPIIRFCAMQAGEPSLSRVESYTQYWYFVFLVVQVFLVTTLSSSATAVAKQIKDNPGSVTAILSQNLPLASNFYISYMIVQGLTVAISVMTQLFPFAIFSIFYKLAGTPRAKYDKWAALSAISWGSVLPVYTNITVIAIAYAGIAPLILGFATVGMYLFYLAYRYNILFVTDTKVDTRGQIYPTALKQLFVGVYLGELCMIGLFSTAAAPGPLVLMVFFLFFTVLFNISLNRAIHPVLQNLPMSLLAEEGGNLKVDGEVPAHGAKPADHEKDRQNGHVSAATEPKKAGNLISRFLSPWTFSDYATLKELVPSNPIDVTAYYTEEVVQNAYHPPSVTSQPPLLWIPSDAAGVSKQEVAHTSRVIPITDDGCRLDDEGNLDWDRETTRPPVWEEKVPY